MNRTQKHNAECPRGAAIQRWGGLLGGSALAIYGLTRRSKSGALVAALGGVMAYRGAKAGTKNHNLNAEASVVINAPPEQLYQFWHNFEDLPRFMRHLESVTQSGDGRSRWTALTHAGRIHWDAEIVSENENQSLAWRSLPGSDIDMEGSVEFRKAPANRGTLVKAKIHYSPTNRPLKSALLCLVGKYPNFIIQQDLRRFKALIETGEIPTTEGQPHGPRSSKVSLARLANPDRPPRPESVVSELYNAARRAS